MQILVWGALLLFFSGPVLDQQKAPPPRGKAAAAVSGKMATVDYGRPVLKGRSLDDLFKELPPDRVWRAGQNQVTTLTTEGDILVGTQKVPAGKYSVYVHVPQTGDWSLILNKDPGVELIKIWPKAPPAMAQELWPYYENYTEKIRDQEVARVEMKSEKPPAPVDMFTIQLQPAGNGATLKMSWSDRGASVDLRPTE